MLERVPVRLRLAAGFAAGLAVVLTLAGAFVYGRVSNELDAAISDSVTSRSEDVMSQIEATELEEVDLGGVRVGEEESAFTQILTPSGRVVDSTLPQSWPVLSSDEIVSASMAPIRLDEVGAAGLEGPFRVEARPVAADGESVIAVVGVSTSDRDEALGEIANAFLLGGPIALALASAIGYALGARALAPVEAIRARAQQITLDEPGERLPSPVAKDELRRLAQTLNEMLDRVEEVLERERAFVADASHELRTPLAILKSEIELARSTEMSRNDLELALDSAAEEVEHLVLLAEDLLVIARAEQGRLPLRRETISVRSVLSRVVDRFQARARDAGRLIELVTEGEGAGDFPADRLRIEQAVTNLLDNSLRHGAGTVRVVARERRGLLSIRVADEGEGFPPDYKERAFERFSQGARGHSQVGAGLGLALVRAIARAHGGEAEIESGAGAAVVLTIPRDPGSAELSPG